MKLTLHVKDIGSFDIKLKGEFVADEETLIRLRQFAFNSEAMYVQLVDNSILFLGKELLKTSYMTLTGDDETDILPEL